VTILMFAALGQAIIKLLLGGVAIFLILLVLVQRGRGGGLAGALGGMGGSSAFGAKAGDIFTKITIVAAAVWIILCMVAAKMGPSEDESHLNTGVTKASASASVEAPAMSSGDETDQAEAETSEVTEESPPAESPPAIEEDTTAEEEAPAESSESEAAPAESKEAAEDAPASSEEAKQE